MTDQGAHAAQEQIRRGQTTEGIIADVTERKQAGGRSTDVPHEVELEEQLRQAQKLEAVGRLAGGVAHQFNNLLSVINGYGELVLSELREGDPMREGLSEIVEAGARAAALTRHLLIFSCRQVLEPEIIDLNALVTNLGEMLRRRLGEDVQLVTQLAEDLGKVKADPGLIEQVVMNLVINARDAMPAGGHLTLKTDRVDAQDCMQPDVTAGSYVRLTVTDTGCGMDPETLERIFEPFFTTKEHGTGLGLSTVYGIVKQSGGFVHVRSEPGSGATFTVHLPGLEEPCALDVALQEKGASPRGSETILVVEDEPAVRRLMAYMLSSAGYQTLVAANGKEALEILSSQVQPVALVLTDMVMPLMSGPELIEQLRRTQPHIRVLYMSGYSDHPVLRNGGSDCGVSFITKPCRKEELLRNVRHILGAPGRHPTPMT